MSKKIILLLVCTSFFFAGCKKEKTSLSEEAVSVVSLPPIRTNTGTSSYRYKLNGNVIAPSTVEATDHGFIILGTSTNVSLGSYKGLGYVETEYTFPSAVSDASVVFYLVFPSGDSLRSDKAGVIKLVSPNLGLSGFSIVPVTAGITQLSLNTNFNYSSGYYIYDEELYYRVNGTSTWSTFPLPINPIISNFLLDGYIPGLSSGITYDFKVKVVLHPPSGVSSSLVSKFTPITTIMYQ